MKKITNNLSLVFTLVLSFAYFVVFSAPLAGSYTINSGAATGGSNFASFKDFADSINANGISASVVVTVTPGSGPYTEQVVINTVTGAGPGVTVTLEGSGETITAVTTTTDRHVIRLFNVQYFTINNLNIVSGAGSAGGFYGVHLFNSASYVTVSNCTVDVSGSTSTLFGSIIASGSTTSILTAGNYSNINITGNTTTGGGYGISLYGLASPLATNIVISGNTIYDFSSNGIYIRETDGVIISGNTLNKRAGSTTITNAIQIAQTANINARIFNNFISFTQTTGSYRGIYLFGGTGHQAYNNAVYNILSETGDITGIEVRAGAPEVFFNTVSIDNSVATTGDLEAFAEGLSNTGTILRNNIFNVTQPTSGLSVGLALSSASTIGTTLNSNYNIFYVPFGNVANHGNVPYATLAAWQAASAQDANSLSDNPFFESRILVRPTNGAVNNKGVNYGGIASDILGGTRGSTPDIGAYEFSPAASDAAVSSINLSVPSCAATLPVEITLTNAGADTLTSATIDWTVNTVAQAVINWTGSVPSGSSTAVLLGNFPVADDSVYNFTVTVSNPNGSVDANTANNTKSYNNWRKGFNGVYTINDQVAASATNYNSFQAIFNDLATHGVCGAVVIEVGGSGVYTEQLIVTAIPNTSAINKVVLSGNGNILQFDATASSPRTAYSTVVLSGVQHLTISNLIINALDAANGYGINIIDGASFLNILDCTVNIPLSITSSTSGAGISTAGATSYLTGTLPPSTNITIANNTINGGGNGIIIVGDFPDVERHSDISVVNNILNDQEAEAIQFLGVNKATVSGNDISRLNRTSSTTYTGIYFWNAMEDYIVEKNKIHGIAGSSSVYGIRVLGNSTYNSSGVVRNNLIYGWTTTGSSFQYGIYDNVSADATVNIYHNTVVLDDSAYTGSGTTRAYYWGTSSNSNTTHNVVNNIFYVGRGGTGTKHLIDVTDTDNSAYLNADNNVLWFANSATGTLYFGELGSTTYTSFANWQTSGNDSLGANVNPAFTNPSAGDYKPTALAIDNIGANVGVLDDIVGIPRSVTPDPGAYEFGLCTPPATPSAIIGGANVCASDAGVTYSIDSVSGATNYIWDVPSDANIVAGQGTTAVTIDFGSQSGDITVSAEDACGASAPATLNITVNALPNVSFSLPTAIVCDHLTAVALSGGVPTGGSYSGANVANGEFNANAAGIGTYPITYTYQDVNGCEGSSLDSITVEVCTGLNENGKTDFEFQVYPNPTDGMVTVKFGKNEGKVNLKIFDILGNEVFGIVAENEDVIITRGQLVAGVYMLVAYNSNAEIIGKQKMVVR